VRAGPASRQDGRLGRLHRDDSHGGPAPPQAFRGSP
jgi:hypothetical protein